MTFDLHGKSKTAEETYSSYMHILFRIWLMKTFIGTYISHQELSIADHSLNEDANHFQSQFMDHFFLSFFKLDVSSLK